MCVCAGHGTYHGGVEEEEDGRPHQRRGAQESAGVGQPQDGHHRSPCQQTPRRGHLKKPLAIAGAHVHQLQGDRRQSLETFPYNYKTTRVDLTATFRTLT